MARTAGKRQTTLGLMALVLVGAIGLFLVPRLLHSTDSTQNIPTEQQMEGMSAAIRTNDLVRLNQALPPAGPLDFSSEAYERLVDLAAQNFAAAAGTSDASQRLPILLELSRRMRRASGKEFSASGNIAVQLSGGIAGAFEANATFHTDSKETFPLKLSLKETAFKGTNFDGGKFSVDFDSKYRVDGFLVGGALEAENVEEIMKAHSGKGIVIPTASILPSTYSSVAVYLNDKNATVIYAAKSGDTVLLSKLLKHDRSLINAKDDRRATPLFWASFYGHKESVMILIENGADVNAREIHNEGVLEAAGSHSDVADLLRQHGAH